VMSCASDAAGAATTPTAKRNNGIVDLAKTGKQLPCGTQATAQHVSGCDDWKWHRLVDVRPARAVRRTRLCRLAVA
jgi:hypothetical protein